MEIKDDDTDGNTSKKKASQNVFGRIAPFQEMKLENTIKSPYNEWFIIPSYHVPESSIDGYSSVLKKLGIKTMGLRETYDKNFFFHNGTLCCELSVSKNGNKDNSIKKTKIELEKKCIKDFGPKSKYDSMNRIWDDDLPLDNYMFGIVNYSTSSSYRLKEVEIGINSPAHIVKNAATVNINDDPSLYKDEQGRSEEIQVRNSTVFLGNKTKQKIYITMINTGDSNAMEKNGMTIRPIRKEKMKNNRNKFSSNISGNTNDKKKTVIFDGALEASYPIGSIIRVRREDGRLLVESKVTKKDLKINVLEHVHGLIDLKYLGKKC